MEVLEQEPRWTPVDKPPREMGSYIATMDYKEHGIVVGIRYYFGKGLKWNDECVIAWMPLPEGYRVRDNV